MSCRTGLVDFCSAACFASACGRAFYVDSACVWSCRAACLLLLDLAMAFVRGSWSSGPSRAPRIAPSRAPVVSSGRRSRSPRGARRGV